MCVRSVVAFLLSLSSPQVTFFPRRGCPIGLRNYVWGFKIWDAIKCFFFKWNCLNWPIRVSYMCRHGSGEPNWRQRKLLGRNHTSFYYRVLWSACPTATWTVRCRRWWGPTGGGGWWSGGWGGRWTGWLWDPPHLFYTCSLAEWALAAQFMQEPVSVKWMFLPPNPSRHKTTRTFIIHTFSLAFRLS